MPKFMVVLTDSAVRDRPEDYGKRASSCFIGNDVFPLTQKFISEMEQRLQILTGLQCKITERCDGNHGGPCCTDPECWNQ